LPLVAATLGREFTFELLKAVSPLEEKILERELSQLEAGLLYQQGVLQQATGRLRNHRHQWRLRNSHGL
jgi:hypothetical protein